MGSAPPECATLVQKTLISLGWLVSRAGRFPGTLLVVFLPRVHPTARTPALSPTQPGKFPFHPREVSGDLSPTPSAVHLLYLHCPPLHTFSGFSSSLCFPMLFCQTSVLNCLGASLARGGVLSAGGTEWCGDGQGSLGGKDSVTGEETPGHLLLDSMPGVLRSIWDKA